MDWGFRLAFFAEIKSLFVHPFLAERIISMLNYFLQHLVGPKMGALKVKDFSEFDFKPQQLVSDICTIYLNLGYLRFNLGKPEGCRCFHWGLITGWRGSRKEMVHFVGERISCSFKWDFCVTCGTLFRISNSLPWSVQREILLVVCCLEKQYSSKASEYLIDFLPKN